MIAMKRTLQKLVSLSSTKAIYVALAGAVKIIVCLKKVL